MKTYPPEHRALVSALLDGKFLLNTNNGFAALCLNEDEYREFFSKSFGHELVLDAEIAYLRSPEASEKDTRNFTLFLAILCREIDLAGRDFRKEIESQAFVFSETEDLLQQSSKWEILEKVMSQGLNSFLTQWFRRNLVQRIGSDAFRFTKAVKVFFDFATSVAGAKLMENPVG